MSFDNDTFVVLDLPEPFASSVMHVRRRHRDEVRMALPVEVTMTGSSGVGVFEPDQDRDTVFAFLDEIAASTAPITARFGPVLHWPPSLYVFSYADEAPLRALNGRLAGSGIRFGPTPFPFTPHTTIRSRDGATDAEREELMGLQIPGEFRLETMSVYEGGPGGPLWGRLLHRVRLGGA
jgi:2'-5' RNA ligase